MHRGAVAQRLDHFDQCRRVGNTIGIRDSRALGRVVHRCGHSIEPIELLLNTRRTRRTGHAGDVEIDGFVVKHLGASS